jgi:hypothetical protein
MKLLASIKPYVALEKPQKKKREKVLFKDVAIRRKFAEEWESLSEEDRLRLRAVRAKAGIKCSICGAVGYYRETCPKKCTVGDTLFKDEHPLTIAAGKEDSQTTSSGTKDVALLWGDLQVADEKTDVSLTNLRDRMNAENAYLKLSDKPLQNYQFFVQSEDGYNRNVAELTLHQVRH